ncbi:MAG: carbohydrate ABC transporter permease [Streptomycetales bacterium]
MRGGEAPARNSDVLAPRVRLPAYTLLTVAAALTVLPLIYMVSLSLQSDAEILEGEPVLWPEALQFGNFARLFEEAPFARFFLNSFIMAGGITLAHLIFDPLAGYVFAKFDFRFKNTLFVIILGTLMVPFFIRMIPLYVIMSNLGWTNTYQGLIAPFLMDAYGIFLMRQFIEPLPDELIDAARVDGASELRIYRSIVLPHAKPALAVLALFTFVYQWNEFLWPLVATDTQEMRTMTVGLTMFNQEHFTQWNLTAAGAVVLFIPTFLLFFVSQRYLVRGIALTGLK